VRISSEAEAKVMLDGSTWHFLDVEVLGGPAIEQHRAVNEEQWYMHITAPAAKTLDLRPGACFCAG
jgi:hypothetical protein